MDGTVCVGCVCVVVVGGGDGDGGVGHTVVANSHESLWLYVVQTCEEVLEQEEG